MLNTKVRFIAGILAVINLGVISGGLVSCGAQEKQPLAPREEERPTERSNESDDDDDDQENDRRDDDEQEDDQD
ncbi:hypothetical protein I8751_17575 [Nostocaceae cyanobacterium CENA357]|uniref:Uncharacterized protein n=1 Tax=Atlanticothrix silvestris CENA357 TaxID=1725252 RepID=A0A8J7HG52_9CYAN|nr:hypothetical protein [Atlanticothrix silvestris]MBH8554143.1 hypothetical protein [Atlanticothrix silvestris CENA357]